MRVLLIHFKSSRSSFFLLLTPLAVLSLEATVMDQIQVLKTILLVVVFWCYSKNSQQL